MKVQLSFNQLLCAVMTLCRVCLATDSNFRRFTAATGKRFNSGANMEYYVSGPMSKLRCAALCGADDNCMSASFQDDGMCYMSTYHLNGPENGQTLTDMVGWSAMSKTVCPNNWIKLGGLCYLFVTTDNTFNQARDYCVQEGGMLAEPRDWTEHDLLSVYMENNMENAWYWIGLTGNEDDGYTWLSNNEEATMTNNWMGGYPAHGDDGTDSCVMLVLTNRYKYRDNVCSFTTYAVCQSDFVF